MAFNSPLKKIKYITTRISSKKYQNCELFKKGFTRKFHSINRMQHRGAFKGKETKLSVICDFLVAPGTFNNYKILNYIWK